MPPIHPLRALLALMAAATVHLGAWAQPAPADSAQLAASIPIADVHMHLYRGLTPEELRGAMDRNNVRWGGGVGPVGPGYDPNDFAKLLGARYFPAGAQAEQYVMHESGGGSELQNTDSPRFKELVEKLKGQFERKEITGIGELVLNNHRSSYAPAFRRKVRIDADTFQVFYGLAAQHQGFVQIHTDDDGDSIRELEAVAGRYPQTPFILSHCLTRASAQTARALLEKHPNLYCETSFRSSARSSAPMLQPFMIHDANGTQAAWLALIEAMPDRFMVGSDVYTKDVSYDAVIGAIRSGLLARLSEPALRKVAHENAVRVFRLPAITP